MNAHDFSSKAQMGHCLHSEMKICNYIFTLPCYNWLKEKRYFSWAAFISEININKPNLNIWKEKWAVFAAFNLKTFFLSFWWKSLSRVHVVDHCLS